MPLNLRIEDAGSRRTLRVLGLVQFRDLVTGLRDAIAATRSDRVARLLIVVDGLAGDAPPTVGERHWLVREWSALGDTRTRVAMVVPAALIDPERFGIVAAANFGIRAGAFADEAEAVAWLDRDD